ncbi:MAG: carboxypeptidase regulatory-like domain-containing protein [Bacteroidota bacterium]
MKRILTTALLLCGLRTGAQEIRGKVVEDRKGPVLMATVLVCQNGILKGRTTTDLNGNYRVTPLEPGVYDVYLLCHGFDTSVTTGVPVTASDRTYVSAAFSGNGCSRNEVQYKSLVVNIDERRRLPLTEHVCGRVYLTTPLYTATRGSDVSIGGARPSNGRRVYNPHMMPISLFPILATSPAVPQCAAAYKLTRKDINKRPYTDVNDIIASYPGIYQRQRGGDISIYGSR